MSTKAIANEDCKIKFTPVTVPPDAVYADDIPYNRTGVTYTLSTKVKCKSKFALLTSFSFAWAAASAKPCPFTSASYTFASGAGSIVATSTKTKCESKFPMRADDAGTCVGVWNSNTVPPVAFPCSCTCKISDAGQDKVLSN